MVDFAFQTHVSSSNASARSTSLFSLSKQAIRTLDAFLYGIIARRQQKAPGDDLLPILKLPRGTLTTPLALARASALESTLPCWKRPWSWLRSPNASSCDLVPGQQIGIRWAGTLRPDRHVLMTVERR